MGAIPDFETAMEIIKELEAQLAALQWQPITESNLPKAGDEVMRLNTSTGNILKYGELEVFAAEALCDFLILEAKDYADTGWTHFRPIGAPDASKG